jgi:hypothetical protein
MASSALLVAFCLALASLIYLGLSQVEWSFGQVTAFLRDRADAVRPGPEDEDELPGKTDRLPFKPKHQ